MRGKGVKRRETVKHRSEATGLFRKEDRIQERERERERERRDGRENRNEKTEGGQVYIVNSLCPTSLSGRQPAAGRGCSLEQQHDLQRSGSTAECQD